MVDHRTATLGDIAVALPAAAPLFEQLGLDYCCGGGTTLDAACAGRGLDAAAVSRMLDDLAAAPAAPGTPAADLRALSIGELCEHILVRRHGPLRVAMQRIGALLTKVVRVHGGAHPELVSLQERFATACRELDAHLRLEEETLFPACRTLGVRTDVTFDEPLLALLRTDHDDAGAALRDLRDIAGGYDASGALCATHRRLLEELAAFESDMHAHVHEENNVLFPRVRAQLAARA